MGNDPALISDSNIINYFRDKRSPWHGWARQAIADAVTGEGAGLNAVVLAELCGYVQEPERLQAELEAMGLEILDVPASAALACGTVYRQYLQARRKESGKEGSKTPLPDFFMGAHAKAKGARGLTRETACGKFPP